jgi:hypothetical protein
MLDDLKIGQNEGTVPEGKGRVDEWSLGREVEAVRGSASAGVGFEGGYGSEEEPFVMAALSEVPRSFSLRSSSPRFHRLSSQHHSQHPPPPSRSTSDSRSTRGNPRPWPFLLLHFCVGVKSFSDNLRLGGGVAGSRCGVGECGCPWLMAGISAFQQVKEKVEARLVN